MLGLAMAAMMSAGCGGDAAERGAFIEFLQRESAGRGRQVTVPSPSMRESFGNYAAQYDIIVNFHRTMNEKAKVVLDTNFSAILNPGTSIAERRKLISRFDTVLADMGKDVENALATAEAELAAFDQPDDVKAAYLPLFDHHVRASANAYLELVPLFGEFLKKTSGMFDFVEANQGKISIGNRGFQVTDRATLDKLNAFQTDIADTTRRIQAIIASHGRR
jgi:hypothetical protein